MSNIKKGGLKRVVFNALKGANLDLSEYSPKQVYDEFLIHQFATENPQTVKRAISEYRTYLASQTEVTDTLFTKKKGYNILAIPDLHAPFIHKDALRFVQDTYAEYDIDEVVFLGDIIDNHFSSFHDSDPDGMAAGEEILEARRQLEAWKTAFPIAKVMIGNHDAIPMRKAFNAGLSKHWIKGIDEVYDLDGWDFVQNYTIGRNFFTHGLGMNVLTRSRQLGLNVIQGHLHSKFHCTLMAVHPEPTFAVQAGCLIDHKSYAFAYGKDGPPQVNGCVVIKDALVRPEFIMKAMY